MQTHVVDFSAIYTSLPQLTSNEGDLRHHHQFAMDGKWIFTRENALSQDFHVYMDPSTSKIRVVEQQNRLTVDAAKSKSVAELREIIIGKMAELSPGDDLYLANIDVMRLKKAAAVAHLKKLNTKPTLEGVESEFDRLSAQLAQLYPPNE